MRTPDRILRADAESLERNPPELTQREQEQYNRILTLTEGIMARRGIHTMTLSGLAVALQMGHATLRRHFPDLDVLLATLIRLHLRKLARAIAQVPQVAPDRAQKMRAAYLACTRSDQGGFTNAHLLLIRDRHLLPDDLLTNIEAARNKLGETLAPGYAEEALGLLDMRALDAPRIEAALATIIATAPKQPQQAAPAPKQAAPIRRERLLPARPPWAPADPLAVFRFGPVPTFPQFSVRPQIHSSA